MNKFIQIIIKFTMLTPWSTLKILLINLQLWGKDIESSKRNNYFPSLKISQINQDLVELKLNLKIEVSTTGKVNLMSRNKYILKEMIENCEILLFLPYTILYD